MQYTHKQYSERMFCYLSLSNFFDNYVNGKLFYQGKPITKKEFKAEVKGLHNLNTTIDFYHNHDEEIYYITNIIKP